jgi:Protein of unknown function (DUF4242)
MELVLVERRFEKPVAFEDIQGQERAHSWCLDAYHVRFLKTFLSKDRRRMLCLYEAPDAEAVRRSQEQARVPFEHAWTCQSVKSPDELSDISGKEYVVVERVLAQPVTSEFVSSALSISRGCMELHRARHLESFLERGGLKMVCVFRAPDAEAVRTANTQLGAPDGDTWTASVHTS